MNRDARFNEGFVATYVQRALADWGAEAQSRTDDLTKPATVEVYVLLPGGDTTGLYRLTIEEVEGS